MRTGIAALLFLILFSYTNISAQEKSPPEKESQPLFSFTLSSGYSSQYVIQNGLELHDDAVHTQGTLFAPYGFYLDAFWSAGLDDSDLNSDAGDEIDWSAGWAKKVFGDFGLEARFSYYDLFKVFDSTKTDLIFPYGEINYGGAANRWLNITTSVAAETPFTADFDDLSQGLLLHWGIRPNFTVLEFLDIITRFDILYDDGALGLDNAVLGRYEAGLLWKLTENFSISAPWVKYSDIYSHIENFDPRKNEFWWGGGIVLTFS